jgi:hypothetical protein
MVHRLVGGLVEMAHKLRTDFHSETGPPGTARPEFGAVGGRGQVEVHGSLITGMGRWALSAHATRHRQKINVQVVARFEGREGPANLEQHTYRATIQNIPAGRYWVRVNHTCFAPSLNLPSEGISPLEVSVLIDADGGEPADETLSS